MSDKITGSRNPSHPCEFDNCLRRVPCDGRCNTGDTHLCEEHENTVPCEYCGSYLHTVASCPEVPPNWPV
jgi:hypothetical protein